MTIMDEETLASALRGAADTFTGSLGATDRILDQASPGESPSTKDAHPPYLVRHRNGSISLVAAALVVLVVGISVPLLRDESGTKNATSSPASPRLAAPTVVDGSGFKALSTSTGDQSADAPTSGEKITTTGSTFSSSIVAAKIESSGSIDLKVDSGKVASSFRALGDLATRNGGYVQSQSAHADTHTAATFTYGTIVLQVPERHFVGFIAQVQRIGQTTLLNTNSANVTAQYVNLRAQINSLDASRRQYLAIMTRATTISGILAVQNQLDTIESQIEQLQGQLNVLSHETTYATLSVTVTSNAHRVAPKQRSGLAKAIHGGVAGFVDGFEWLLRLAGPVLFAILALGSIFGLLLLTRRSLRRRKI